MFIEKIVAGIIAGAFAYLLTISSAYAMFPWRLGIICDGLDNIARFEEIAEEYETVGPQELIEISQRINRETQVPAACGYIPYQFVPIRYHDEKVEVVGMIQLGTIAYAVQVVVWTGYRESEGWLTMDPGLWVVQYALVPILNGAPEPEPENEPPPESST